MKKTLLTFLLVAFASALCQHAYAQAVFVANPSVKVADASKTDLRDVFSGASSSLGGYHVIPVLLKQGPAHEAFLSEYAGKSDAAFRASWRSLVFSGQGTMPRTFDSESALLDYVAATPGAIGYVSKSANREKVKTIAMK